MTDLHLILGNKNYSSWSLRAWILCAHAELEFTETVIPLFSDEGQRQLRELTPAGLVPVLMIGEDPVWDSLAIGETLTEMYPEKHLWPVEPRARAYARSVSNEMHSGFTALRSAMPMNCRSSVLLKNIPVEVQVDIDRIQKIWRDCRKHFSQSKGPWLFGEYSIADAMYAPIVSRFNSYQIELDDVAREYSATVMNDPLLQRWYQDGAIEDWSIDSSDKPFL